MKNVLLSKTFKSGNIYELGIYLYSIDNGNVNKIIISNTCYHVEINQYQNNKGSTFSIQFFVEGKKRPYSTEVCTKEEAAQYIKQMFKSNGINL